MLMGGGGGPGAFAAFLKRPVRAPLEFCGSFGVEGFPQWKAREKFCRTAKVVQNFGSQAKYFSDPANSSRQPSCPRCLHRPTSTAFYTSLCPGLPIGRRNQMRKPAAAKTTPCFVFLKNIRHSKTTSSCWRWSTGYQVAGLNPASWHPLRFLHVLKSVTGASSR